MKISLSAINLIQLNYIVDPNNGLLRRSAELRSLINRLTSKVTTRLSHTDRRIYAEKRPKQETIHNTHDKNHARKLTTVLMLHLDDTASDVASTLYSERSLLSARLTGSHFMVLTA